jgi:uncharacterized protein
MEFEWDQNKADVNLSKHGVSFDETITVFDDPLYLDFFDPDHSHDEYRYIIMGRPSDNRILFVSYTEHDESVRIISAREGNQKIMKKDKIKMNDELRPEYDLRA